MVRFKDFEDEKGNTNWDAYHRAQVQAGERCQKCNSYIVFGAGHPDTCSRCRMLVSEKDEVQHRSRVRCPKCERDFDPTEEGEFPNPNCEEMDLVCYCCDHRFSVGISFEVTYTSPPVIKEDDKEDAE